MLWLNLKDLMKPCLVVNLLTDGDIPLIYTNTLLTCALCFPLNVFND